MLRRFTLALAGTFLAVPIFSAAPASAQTPVVVNDFEDGTTQGWIPRGPVALTNTDEVGSRTGGAGTRSLETTGRTQGFHGPSLNVFGLLTNSATYQVSVWVRLAAAGSAGNQVRVTVQRTVNGSNSFDTVATSNAVANTGWTQLSGLYAFAGTDPSALLLYVEATDGTLSYYIDDFRIDKIADPPGPPPNTNGLVSTFETGTTEGWTARIGPEVVSTSSADAHGGAFSLLTTGRTTAFRGPAHDVTNVMFNGSRYRVSLWVKLAPGEQPAQLRVSLQRNAGSLTTFHTVIGNTNVTADAWVRLTTTYNVALANTSLTLYVESASSLASFYVDDVQITYLPPPSIEPDIPSVFETLADFFPVGAGGVGSLEITGVHGDLTRKHFNSLTSGNDMKWDATERTEGSFSFTSADQQVAFAQANGMRVRGHTLLWHNQIPAWVFTDPATGAPMQPSQANHDLLLQRLSNHIRGVVPHFGDKVYAWDVVNEVIDESQTDCLRRSPWYTITGTDFLDTAFRTAREVAPSALLFINDYNTTIPRKRACLFNVVHDLLARGVPVDGVGHQMHDNVEFPSPSDMAATLDLFATLALTQQVTEMDVSVYSGSFSTPVANYDEIPPDRFLKQARHYRDFFQVFKDHKDQLSSVTSWGVADDNTWLTSSGKVDGPLLFDDQLKHKLAYTAIVSPQDLPKDPATVTLSNLTFTYDGNAHAATVATVPPGLPVVVTYSGSLTPPTGPGSYAVVATVDDPNYAGTATGTLLITTTVLVRHAPTLNGRMDGSVQMLLAESTTLNGSAFVSGDLLVPGTPDVRLNGLPRYGGTLDGVGSDAPAGYTITLNGQAALRHVVRRTDPVSLPVVTPPPSPSGTRDVVLNGPGQSAGDFATLRNLTLNGGVGLVAVPPGTYGSFTANGGSGFVLGVAGATDPAVYNLQALTLNGTSQLQVVGPVVLTVAGGLSVNGTLGTPAHPEWLSLGVSGGGVTVNGNAHVHGFVSAPSGSLMVNGTLHGGLAADRLTVNGGGTVQAT